MDNQQQDPVATPVQNKPLPFCLCVCHLQGGPIDKIPTIPQCDHCTPQQAQALEGVVIQPTEQQPNKKLTGFALNPDNINRNGRPKRDWTWTGLLEQAAEEERTYKNGSKYRWKEVVARKLFQEAMNGNVQAIKELMNRMDGMPDQNQNITADRDVKVAITRE